MNSTEAPLTGPLLLVGLSADQRLPSTLLASVDNEGGGMRMPL